MPLEEGESHDSTAERAEVIETDMKDHGKRLTACVEPIRGAALLTFTHCHEIHVRHRNLLDMCDLPGIHVELRSPCLR